MKNKKLTSVLLAFAVLCLSLCICSFSAFAETTTKYWEPRPNCQAALGYVNGEPIGNIYTVADSETQGCKITYDGSGKLTGWEFPLLEEGKDYEIISQKGNSIIIKLLNESKELPYINALVDFGSTTTAAAKTEKKIQTTVPEKAKAAAAKLSADTNSAASETTVYNTKAVSEAAFAYTTEPTTDFADKAAAETDVPNGTKTVLISVAVGAAVCIIFLLVLKKKKFNS